MHNRMMRFLGAAALALTVPAVALASSARVEGLNVPGDYIKDYTGIYTYLSGVSSVGNLAYAETGSEDGGFQDRAVGAVLGNLFDGKLGTWAVHLRELHPGLGQATWAGELNPDFTDPNSAGEAFDVMWGHKMGTTSLGLRLNRTFQSTDNGTVKTEGAGNFSRNIFGVGAGLGFDVNPNASAELSVLFQNRTFDTGTGLKDDGGTDFQLAGRMMWKSGSNLVWTPVAKFFSFDQSTQNGAAKDAEKANGWQLGVAGNWALNNDDLLVLGVQFAGNHLQSTPVVGGPTTDINETFYPNVFLGFETHVNSWLTLRAGAQNAALASLRTANGTTTTTDHGMRFTYNMGAGVKAGGLQLDATLDSEFASNPIAQLVGGTNAQFGSNTVPFPHVVATYPF